MSKSFASIFVMRENSLKKKYQCKRDKGYYQFDIHDLIDDALYMSFHGQHPPGRSFTSSLLEVVFPHSSKAPKCSLKSPMISKYLANLDS